MTKPITIVGGGLAGLSLGIGLRRRDIPVTIVEAGHYPRHRVCGEFINGRGRGALRELDLEPGLYQAGAREAKSAVFHSTRATGRPHPLPEPALCLSRFILDQFLAKEFCRLGGRLEEGRRWLEPCGEGVVRGTGRRVATNSRWMGLKAHARNVALEADLEVHLCANGYIGLCQLNENVVNMCGLFRAPGAEAQLGRNWKTWLRGSPGSKQWERLGGAKFVEESFCAVAGLDLAPAKSAELSECCIGDAITMIAPLTGNGMSMAFEAATLALPPLQNYSRGEIEWKAARAAVAKACDEAFAPRLRWSRALQKVTLCPGLNDLAVAVAGRWPWLWRQLCERTR
jgi:flavin-dependent dehydrogenase